MKIQLDLINKVIKKMLYNILQISKFYSYFLYKKTRSYYLYSKYII